MYALLHGCSIAIVACPHSKFLVFCTISGSMVTTRGGVECKTWNNVNLQCVDGNMAM